jgi:hypothetical protein
MEYLILMLIVLFATAYIVYIEKKNEDGKIPFK